MKKTIIALTAVIVTSGCAAKLGTTVPGEKYNLATGTGYTDTESVKMASDTAIDYCKKIDKKASVFDTTTSYHGSISASTRDKMDEVIDEVFIADSLFPDAGSDDDYKTTVKFHCN